MSDTRKGQRATLVLAKNKNVCYIGIMTDILLTGVTLAEHTTYKIGGPARYFAEAQNELDIVRILEEYSVLNARNNKVFILGGGANVLFSDSGYDGLVLKISIANIDLIPHGVISVGAGAKLQDVVLFALEHGLTGLEWAAGIPGSFGGAIRGNAGAFGGEMKDCVIATRSVTIQNPKKIIERQLDDLGFGYRTSIFKLNANDEIILSGEIQLARGELAEIKQKIEQNIKYRQERQPTDPSAGSTFKNIDISNISAEQQKAWSSVIKTDPKPVMPVAFLISEAGLKGKIIGGAQISNKHSNFFVNTGGATAKDIKELIAITKKIIKEKFNISVEEEIQIVSE